MYGDQDSDGPEGLKDDDITFDENLYQGSSHTEYSLDQLKATQAAADAVKSLVVNEFLTEAVTAAIQLRNVLGDSDGHAADLSQTIASNITVVLTEIAKNPAEFTLAVLRAQDESQRALLAEDIMVKIKLFIESQGVQP